MYLHLNKNQCAEWKRGDKAACQHCVTFWQTAESSRDRARKSARINGASGDKRVNIETSSAGSDCGERHQRQNIQIAWHIMKNIWAKRRGGKVKFKSEWMRACRGYQQCQTRVHKLTELVAEQSERRVWHAALRSDACIVWDLIKLHNLTLLNSELHHVENNTLGLVKLFFFFT